MSVTAVPRQMKTGNWIVPIYQNGDIVCDVVVQPNGTITIGGDLKVTSGAMACHRAARPNWKRHRLERLP